MMPGARSDVDCERMNGLVVCLLAQHYRLVEVPTEQALTCFVHTPCSSLSRVGHRSRG